MFDNVVFAGGGNRCVWQVGFYRTVADVLGLNPARAAGASAGAAMAIVLFAGRFDAALEHFKRATARNRRNVYWGNLLNGGIADNVPVSALGDAGGRTLVLLTRRYGSVPAHPSRVYVQPSTDLPVASWDYTNPAGLQAAYDLGRRDGEAFVRELYIVK